MSKVWFITGSSRGLGRALAEAVLAAGHRLVATARNPEELRTLVATAPDRSRAVALDVMDPAAARKAIDAAVAAFGRIDVLVNNAGYANVASIEDLPEDDFRAQVETNFFGVVNVTRAALPVLRAQRDGHIIQVSSIGGRSGSPGLAAYQSAKWAVGGFSEVLATEVRPLGIRVTIVEPGGMRTDWAGSSMRVLESRPEYQGVLAPFSHMRGDAIMRGVRPRSRRRSSASPRRRTLPFTSCWARTRTSSPTSSASGAARRTLSGSRSASPPTSTGWAIFPRRPLPGRWRR